MNPSSVGPTYLISGLERKKPTSHVLDEHRSDVFKRAVAELREVRSPGRRKKETVEIDVPLPTRSVTPRSVRSTSAATSVSARRPPPAEPFSFGAARKIDFHRASPYQHETYFTGRTIQDEVIRRGNMAPGMSSHVPRFYELPEKHDNDAEPPEKLPGVAVEQLRRPNAGVGFSMTAPRQIHFSPSFVDPLNPRTTIRRSIKFNHLSKPAVWLLDQKQNLPRAQSHGQLEELRSREVSRVIDEWNASTSFSIVQQLEELGYTPLDAVGLANSLKRGVPLHALTNAERKRLELFKSKLGEACLDRLRSLPLQDVQPLLIAHGFTAKQQQNILMALYEIEEDTS